MKNRRCKEIPIGTLPKNNDKYFRILDAAATVFARQGFFQSTVAQVAKTAGVADGTIYLYFKNKDDILAQFVSYKMKEVFTKFRREVAKADAAVDKLRNLVRCHLMEFQRDSDMATVYLAETHQRSRIAEKQLREMSQLYHTLVSEIVELGQQQGSLRRDLYVSLVRRFIIGAVDEVVNTWLHTDSSYDLTTMADPLVDLIIRGIGNPETDAPDNSGPPSPA